MCEGKSTKEIGAALSITLDTVKTHVKGIFYWLNVISRVEAVSLALRRALNQRPLRTSLYLRYMGRQFPYKTTARVGTSYARTRGRPKW